MLHALGITHVVSVGECALVPPMNIASDDSSCGYQFIAGKGPHGQGSLWMEEREGRIKVLDIKVRSLALSILPHLLTMFSYRAFVTTALIAYNRSCPRYATG